MFSIPNRLTPREIPADEWLSVPIASVSRLSHVHPSNVAVCGVLAAAVFVAGCAPGVNSRSLGRERSPEPAAVVVDSSPPAREVVVVEAATQQPAQPSAAAQIRKHENEIARLRDELDTSRSRADAAVIKAREAEQAVFAMQTELAEIRASADAASVQSQKAFDIATEVFSNLIAAREAQRGIVERNLETFGAMDQRLASIERLVGETRSQRESDVAAAMAVSAETELKLQEADRELALLREQLTQLNLQNEQLRGAFDSAPMMSMLRELEATRRETSMLRGAMEEVRREQEAGRKRLQDYYIDLDARIQALQERRSVAPDATTDGVGSEFVPLPGTAPAGLEAADSESLNAPDAADVPGNRLESAVDGDALPPLEIVPYEIAPHLDEGAGTAATPRPQEVPAQDDSLLQEQTDLIESARARAESGGEDSPLPGNASETPAAIEGATRKRQQTAEPQPVTAHGVMTTDWETGERTADPVMPAE